MTKTHRKATGTSEDAFHRHYANIWGQERWHDSLYPALLKSTRYVCLLNRYTDLREAHKLICANEPHPVQLSLPTRTLHPTDSPDGLETPNCWVRPIKVDETETTKADESVAFPHPTTSPNQLATHWNLDAASVLAASLLDVQPGDNVLDLCAAPGGKSIAIAQRLWPHLHVNDTSMKEEALKSRAMRLSSLHSNEFDGVRQRRLAENLKSYLPKLLFDNNQVTTLRIDGAKPNVEYELRVKTPNGTVGYDKVLVDAPCSSERHIVHAQAKAISAGKVADEMANWRPGSSKRLASTQVDLLLTGIRAANVGATVLYATCSIEPTENDGVVEKVMLQLEKDRKKRGLRWKVEVGFCKGKGDKCLEDDLLDNWAESTKYGWIVLPDHPAGGQWGPLYFAMLNKIDAAP